MTTRDLLFGDSSRPPAEYPADVDGWAFYIGGDTPHVWTLGEVLGIPARFRLPIFVRSDPHQANPMDDAEAVVWQLHNLRAPAGCMVALDTETAVDPSYVAAFYNALASWGYRLIDYGSQRFVVENHVPDGYYWGADWTDVPHIVPGDEITQFAVHQAYDESLALPALPFWDTRPSRIPRLVLSGRDVCGVTTGVMGRVSVYSELNADRSLWVAHELHDGRFTDWRQITRSN